MSRRRDHCRDGQGQDSPWRLGNPRGRAEWWVAFHRHISQLDRRSGARGRCVWTASPPHPIRSPASFRARVLAAHNDVRARAGGSLVVGSGAWHRRRGVCPANGFHRRVRSLGSAGAPRHRREPVDGDARRVQRRTMVATGLRSGGCSSPGVFPGGEPHRQLGGRRPLFADRVAGDDARRVRAGFNRAGRLSGVPLLARREYRRPVGAAAVAALSAFAPLAVWFGGASPGPRWSRSGVVPMRWRLTSRKLRVFERKKKTGVGYARARGTRAEQAESMPTLPAMRAIVPFGHAEVARFPHNIGAERRRGRKSADHRYHVEDDVEPDFSDWCRG